jgi:hypothetical protein
VTARHNAESAARPGSASKKNRDNGHTEIPHLPSPRKDDQALIQHIIDRHLPRLASSWELAFLQSLRSVKGELNTTQRTALRTVWQRLQVVRS